MTPATPHPTPTDPNPAAAADAKAELPLAIWPCAQQTSQSQRRDRYLTDSNRHPGKMLPELARRAISAYSQPGDLVVDPMCGIGTTLVEAIHLDRQAVGVELERRWAALATANIAHAQEQGATGRGGIIEGDASELPRLLTHTGRKADTQSGQRKIAQLGVGSVDLILTSPPYAQDVATIDKPAWIAGGSLGAKDTRNYSSDPSNLGHARGPCYLTAMEGVYAASAAVLKPGGFLVVVTKNLRTNGALLNLAGDTINLCRTSGLLYWQHVIALLAAIRDDRLIPRPSLWQLTATRKALTRGDRPHLVCHEDVLVFRKPNTAKSAAEVARQSTRADEARRAA